MSEFAPLHPRNNTFPGEVLLRLAADALDWCGGTTPCSQRSPASAPPPTGPACPCARHASSSPSARATQHHNYHSGAPLTGSGRFTLTAHIGGYGLSGLRQTELQGLTGVHRPFALDRRPWAAQGPRWMDRAPCAEHPVQAELRGDVLQSRRRVRVRRGTVRCARRTVGMPVRLHSAVNAHVRPRAGPVLAAGARVESTLRTRSPRSFPGLTRTRSSASASSGR